MGPTQEPGRPPGAGGQGRRAVTTWMSGARCRDYPPQLFFPTDGAGVLAARRVCAGCQVATECLEFALDRRIRYGVWGGASERARQRIAVSRRQVGRDEVGARG